jgi:hypothetical protein
MSGAVGAGASAGVVVYEQNFENPALIGSEWSNVRTEAHGVFTRFSERRTNNPLTLTLTTVTGQAYSLLFDLYLIDSWDGSNQEWGGPDTFGVRIGDTLAFSETMDNDPGSFYKTFRDPDEAGHLGFGAREYDNDAIYRGILLDFVAGGPLTTIAFFGTGLQGKNDESWGIDNLRVAAIPAPAGALAIGLAGLALARRRERMTD